MPQSTTALGTTSRPTSRAESHVNPQAPDRRWRDGGDKGALCGERIGIGMHSLDLRTLAYSDMGKDEPSVRDIPAEPPPAPPGHA